MGTLEILPSLLSILGRGDQEDQYGSGESGTGE